MEPTPDISFQDFEPVKGAKARRNISTGEFWERDLLYHDHWEVYKSRKQWENGIRDRAVWNDGRLKQRF